MAINKLNLNGTVYDIGEAEGTNTAESIVEFDSGDQLDPSSADESVELIKSGDTHKSLLEKISAGMRNIRYLLKQVTSLNSALADLNDYEVATLSLNSSLTEYGVQRAIRIGKICFVYFYFNATSTVSGGSTVCTLPEGFRPARDFTNVGVPSVRGSSQTASVNFYTDGTIVINGGSLSGFHAFTYVFPVA